jgi:oxygen-independent coproporphyrinogen-3 oxidase
VICLRNVLLNYRKINRLSIGIQSFFEDDLQMMNRLIIGGKKMFSEATQYFDNILI